MNGAFAWEQGSEQPRAGAWPELWEKAALFLALVSWQKQHGYKDTQSEQEDRVTSLGLS